MEAVRFICCDATRGEALRAVFTTAIGWLGTLKICVNNAGIADESNWEAMLELNLTAVIRGTFLVRSLFVMGLRQRTRG